MINTGNLIEIFFEDLTKSYSYCWMCSEDCIAFTFATTPSVKVGILTIRNHKIELNSTIGINLIWDLNDPKSLIKLYENLDIMKNYSKNKV